MKNELEVPINPHVWRKFKQAERNMMKCLSLRHRRIGHKQFRRARYWAIEMSKWSERLL